MVCTVALGRAHLTADFCSQAPGKYTVVADCEKAGPQELSVKSGDVVQLIREAEEGQW